MPPRDGHTTQTSHCGVTKVFPRSSYMISYVPAPLTPIDSSKSTFCVAEWRSNFHIGIHTLKQCNPETGWKLLRVMLIAIHIDKFFCHGHGQLLLRRTECIMSEWSIHRRTSWRVLVIDQQNACFGLPREDAVKTGLKLIETYIYTHMHICVHAYMHTDRQADR